MGYQHSTWVLFQHSHFTRARLWFLAMIFWLVPLILIQAGFTEELLIHPQPDGNILAHFDFKQEILDVGDAMPGKIQALLEKHPVQELHLAFALGRWFADNWGPPPILVTPPGATLRARFVPFDQPAELQQAWGNLTHALSGLFCASLNFLADPALVAMPSYSFDHHSPATVSQWLYGSLPREAVCTENLTPWLKLLPCQGRQGLAQLLDRPTLYAASFHSMQVHLTARQPAAPLPHAEAAAQNTCTDSIADDSEQAATPYTPASLHQTLTIMVRPNQLHGPQPQGHILGWGSPLQQNITLQRLFNVQAVSGCPKASHTHIYWQLPRPIYAKLSPDNFTLDASATSNQLYSFSPVPDAVITSSDSLFALHNLTAPRVSHSNDLHLKHAPPPATATANSNSSKLPSQQWGVHTHDDSAPHFCVEPSLTWLQQPPQWAPPAALLQVQQLLAGRLGDRGTLVLHISLNASAQHASAQRASAQCADNPQSCSLGTEHDTQRQGEHAQQQANDWHEFCVLQMVPWHFQLLFHTLRLDVDGQETSLGLVLTGHVLQPAEGQGTTATLELCFRISSRAQVVRLSIAFQKAFLTVFDHPPDANRGFDMPSALVTNLLAQPLHQAPWTILQQQGASPEGAKLQKHQILSQLSTLSGRHVYSNGVLVPMPTPDFSMPYNVCCLTCTVLALYVMGINAAVFSKPEIDEADAKQNKAARRRQLAGVLLLVLTFGSLAVSTDKALQRQLKSIVGMGSDD